MKKDLTSKIKEYIIPIYGDYKFWKNKLRDEHLKNPKVEKRDQWPLLGLYLAVKYGIPTGAVIGAYYLTKMF